MLTIKDNFSTCYARHHPDNQVLSFRTRVLEKLVLQSARLIKDFITVKNFECYLGTHIATYIA